MREIPALDGRACHWLLRSALASWAAGSAPVVASDTSIALQLDADWVTWIRAQRRAQGLDSPDPAADAQFRAMVQRLQGLNQRAQAVVPDRAVPAAAATAHCAAAPSWSAPVLRGADMVCKRAADTD